MTAKEKNDIISHLYNTQHKWLIACSFNFTKNQDKAEEVVQTLYLQLLEMDDLTKIIYQGQSLNQFYLYKMLKSLFVKSINKQTPTHEITLAIEETYEGDDYMNPEDNIEHQIQGYINEAMEQIHFFDRLLFETYLRENHSIMSLHKATKISTSTIWSSQQKLKKFIKHYVNEKLKNKF